MIELTDSARLCSPFQVISVEHADLVGFFLVISSWFYHRYALDLLCTLGACRLGKSFDDIVIVHIEHNRRLFRSRMHMCGKIRFSWVVYFGCVWRELLCVRRFLYDLCPTEAYGPSMASGHERSPTDHCVIQESDKKHRTQSNFDTSLMPCMPGRKLFLFTKRIESLTYAILQKVSWSSKDSKVPWAPLEDHQRHLF